MDKHSGWISPAKRGAFLFLSALGLFACGEAHPLQISAHRSQIQQAIDWTAHEAPGYFDLYGYTIHVEISVHDANIACTKHHSASNALACTDINSQDMWLPWGLTLPEYPNPRDSYTIGAQALAHEIGHIYFDETEHDADINHTHTEWFANYGDSVVRRVGARAGAAFDSEEIAIETRGQTP